MLRRAAERAALEELLAEAAWALDSRDFERYAGCFTDEATYEAGGQVLRGRSEIVGRFTARAGERLTRHLCGGLRCTVLGEGVWRARSVWLTFAGEGTPPIDLVRPYQVADFDDEVVEHGGRLLIRSRRITSVFRDPGLGPRG